MLRNLSRCLVSLAIVGLLAAGAANAQMLRQFEGEVQKKSDSNIVVDNKKGDKIAFEKADTTEVLGEKAEWGDVKKGDWVAVHSKMLEKPRKAYKVEVLPEKE